MEPKLNTKVFVAVVFIVVIVVVVVVVVSAPGSLLESRGLAPP